ncbi:MAG TPA: leucyl aminopeptidase [Geobacteraceae bacterium]|nr:leucyl aminopeptidase [Geobacteraceae bacterium]
MNCKLHRGDPLRHRCKVLVVGCFMGESGNLVKALDRELQGAIDSLVKRKEFTGAEAQVALLHSGGRLPAESLLLVGLGEKRSATAETLRRAMGWGIRRVRAARVGSCCIVVNDSCAPLPESAAATITGCLLGDYGFERYKTVTEGVVPGVETVTLLVPAKADKVETERAVHGAEQLFAGVKLARDLVSEPCNVATPGFIAAAALKSADESGFSCRVMDEEEIRTLGMGGLLAVSRGSVEKPRCLVLEYLPQGDGVAPVALVGKGVTFDSGGISLKPREGMERMKDDMAGAAAVIGTFAAAARLGLPVNLVGVVPLTENLPDGMAYKPGDVVVTMAGKTVEIVNTDAEGRMILCDALHYALRYKPRVMIDLATLTGACLVALGTEASGMFGTDAHLKRALLKAGESTGERLWELPLWDEYGELMKSDIADMKNAGGPHAGSISAAWFLKQFVGRTKWVHLDIAGTAWEEKGTHYLPKGATGVGVRLLVEYLRREYPA